MAVKISPDYIDLLNKAVEREIQVSLQYILQHAKMEKLVRRTIPENILLRQNHLRRSWKVPKRNLHPRNETCRRNNRAHLLPWRKSLN